MKKHIAWILLGSLLLLLTAGCSSQKPAKWGFVETEEIDIAAKIPGRIIDIKVKEGDHVTKGQVLAILQSDEIHAKVEQAKAGLEATNAQLQMAVNGARDEEKRMAQRQFNIAQNNREILQRTYERMLKVFQEGGISLQEKETAEFRWKIAQEQYEQAKAFLDMVNKGARKEQIAALKAAVRAAEERVKEAESYANETEMRASQDADVKAINVQIGEIVTAGFAAITLLDPNPYVVFNLKESEFKGLKIGDTLKAEVPALESSPELKVYYISVMADIAKQESTQEKNSWDVKTFEVRSRPAAVIPSLRPGMSVRIQDR